MMWSHKSSGFCFCFWKKKKKKEGKKEGRRDGGRPGNLKVGSRSENTHKSYVSGQGAIGLKKMF